MEEFEIEDKIRDFIKNVALGPVKGFYPSAAARYANISTDKAFNYLLRAVDQGALKLKWELRCPQFGCYKMIKLSSSNEVGNNYVCCPFCGLEFEPKITDFFPRFEINVAYKKYELNKIKKKTVQLLM